MYNDSMTNRIFDISDAIQSLYPGSQWTLENNEYEKLNWVSTDIEKPELAILEEERDRLQAEYDALEYQRLRAPEYPSITDYLDGIVKGDQDQIDQYIAACLAVKAKYPKPVE